MNIPMVASSVLTFITAEVLLTPFRFQNVPPPMSSFQLSLAHEYSARTPIHVAFSSNKHVLGALRHEGHMELWNVQPRLEMRSDKPFDLISIWHGSNDQLGKASIPRQLCVWSLCSSDNDYRLACLASDETNDVIYSVDVNASADFWSRLSMPGQGGRLLHSLSDIFWQASDGQIHRSKFAHYMIHYNISLDVS